MMNVLERYAEAINNAIANTPIGYYFRLEGSGHPKAKKGARFLKDIQAGITTFFCMAYIISVNAGIIAQTGGTCECNTTDTTDPFCFKDQDYAICQLEVNRDLITATAAVSAMASFCMGLFTNLPVALAPGMGLNAYFTYQVVGVNGSGSVSYRMALTAVFVEGFIFVGLSVFGLRQWLARIIPSSIKIACSAGIGLYLAFIGLGTGAGIGVITGAVSTPVELAGCLDQYKDPVTGVCLSHKLENPTVWIGLFLGGLLTTYLMMYKVKSAMMIGIFLVAIFSWPRGTNFTYFPDNATGDERFNFFKKVVDFHQIKHTLAVQEWDLSKASGQFILALFTFLYVDILDCTGTLYSMARFSGAVDPDTGDFERSTIAYCTDATFISIGALFGTSPVTAFIESGAGITIGGKTGIVAMTTGFCFFISLFFAPIFASIPPWATGGVLVLVGCMMMKSVLGINWNYSGDAVPAFITMMFMPFSYSIAYGLIAGVMSYIFLNGLAWVVKFISGGRIAPADEDLKEYWSYRSHGASPAPWFVRAARGERRWWSSENDNVLELSSVVSSKGHQSLPSS